jgi:hypothetical protein
MTRQQSYLAQNSIDRDEGYTACIACIAANGLAIARAMLRAEGAREQHTFGFWCGWLHACACCVGATAK